MAALTDRLQPFVAQRYAPIGDDGLNQLFTDTYIQLRRLASSWLYRERVGHTLSPTALVHEAYLSLRRTEPDSERGKAYFLASAARAMRRVLVDHARAKGALKRGGGCSPIRLEGLAHSPGDVVTVLDLDDALERLAMEHRRSSRVAEFKLFADMASEQIADVLRVSIRTVSLDWRFARAYLCAALSAE